MTWKEFKDRVEQQGVRDEDIINFIDVSNWLDEISVERNDDLSVEIIS